MFSKSIDNKKTYSTEDGYQAIDLGESIFTNDNIYDGIGYTIYRTPKEMEMRPDLAAMSAYNGEEYTELLLKYNNIQNPFSLAEDDILVIPSSTQIETHTGKIVNEQKENADKLIRNLHNYVDKNKLPDTNGSEKDNSVIKKANDTSKLTGASNTNSSGTNTKKLTGNTATRFKEANLATLGASQIKEINGRLYFGTDAGMKCAANGISTSDYLKEIIKNSTDNKK